MLYTPNYCIMYICGLVLKNKYVFINLFYSYRMLINICSWMHPWLVGKTQHTSMDKVWKVFHSQLLERLSQMTADVGNSQAASCICLELIKGPVGSNCNTTSIYDATSSTKARKGQCGVHCWLPSKETQGTITHCLFTGSGVISFINMLTHFC
jgi:hypothetical protein